MCSTHSRRSVRKICVGVGVGVGVSLQRIIYYARAGATAHTHTHTPFRTVWRDLRWSSHNNIAGPTAGLAGLIRVKKVSFFVFAFIALGLCNAEQILKQSA